jgi:phosphatidylinositol dimannoside acyltransferase
MSGPLDRLARRSGQIRDVALRRLFRLGWRTAHRIPTPVVSAALAVAARVAVRRPGRHVQTLRRNLALTTGRPVDDRLLRAAVRSHLRNVYEMLALPGWRSEQVLARIETVNEPQMRAAYASTGAVVVLPHSGNWDLAGAYAQLTAMPVTTVAEALPDEDFAAFVAFRERLGMQVLSHRDPAVIGELLGAVRAGRLVCLLGDRDLAGSGVPVRWAGQPITMPAGPAVVARRSGAALIPIVCQFTPRGMRIVFSDPIPHRKGRDGLVAMTQEVADFFVATLARQPEDWHMMQRFFPADAAVPASDAPSPVRA